MNTHHHTNFNFYAFLLSLALFSASANAMDVGDENTTNGATVKQKAPTEEATDLPDELIAKRGEVFANLKDELKGFSVDFDESFFTELELYYFYRGNKSARPAYKGEDRIMEIAESLATQKVDAAKIWTIIFHNRLEFFEFAYWNSKKDPNLFNSIAKKHQYLKSFELGTIKDLLRERKNKQIRLRRARNNLRWVARRVAQNYHEYNLKLFTNEGFERKDGYQKITLKAESSSQFWMHLYRPGTNTPGYKAAPWFLEPENQYLVCLNISDFSGGPGNLALYDTSGKIVRKKRIDSNGLYRLYFTVQAHEGYTPVIECENPTSLVISNMQFVDVDNN